MLLDTRRDPTGSTPALGKSSHKIQECPGRDPRRWFRLDGPKFRHHLVVHRDLDARAGVSLDSADKGRQLLTGFADREFHHGLQVKMSESTSMYKVCQHTPICLPRRWMGEAGWAIRDGEGG
jgi:hypothetical protein